MLSWLNRVKSQSGIVAQLLFFKQPYYGSSSSCLKICHSRLLLWQKRSTYEVHLIKIKFVSQIKVGNITIHGKEYQISKVLI